MRQIGLTGGIGSGKSTVARVFESAGYLVYYADTRAKALYEEDQGLKAGILDLMGPEAYDAAGKLNRQLLAKQIFADKALLAKVNALVHPCVGRDFDCWMAAIPTSYGKGFVLKEAAILFEAGTYRQSDGVLTVYAPKSLRVERVTRRDETNQAAVLQRMANQWPDSRKMQLADFIIFNDGQHPIIPQVMDAIRYFEQQ